MNHDPLCPTKKAEQSEPTCWPCELIAKARADEREKAEKRISTLKPDRVYTAGGIAYVDALRDAIEAVHGRADIVREATP